MAVHWTAHLQERLSCGSQRKDGEIASWVSEGKLFVRGNVLRDCKRVLGRAEHPALRFQDLRHPSATLSHTAGVAVKVVAERLDHSNISLTL